MSTAVMILRCIALLAFGTPMLIRRAGGHRSDGNVSREAIGSRLPFAANVAACALFVVLLIVASGGARGARALVLAGTGSVLAVGGSAVILFSRAELGEAWSFVPRAAEQPGLVITGPYRLVRHPIYLGLSMVAAGQTIAFSSGPAFLVVVAAVIPSFLWRARVEEALLTNFFGDRYLRYRERTSMIIPYVL